MTAVGPPGLRKEKSLKMEGSAKKQELLSILDEMKNAENEMNAIDIGRRFQGCSALEALSIAKAKYPNELGHVVIDSTVSLMDLVGEVASAFHDEEEDREGEGENGEREEEIVDEMDEELSGRAYEEDDREGDKVRDEAKKRKVEEQQPKLTDDEIRKHIRALAPVVRRVTSRDHKTLLLTLLEIQKADVLDVERIQPLLHALFPVHKTWPEYYQQEFLLLYNLDRLR